MHLFSSHCCCIFFCSISLQLYLCLSLSVHSSNELMFTILCIRCNIKVIVLYCIVSLSIIPSIFFQSSFSISFPAHSMSAATIYLALSVPRVSTPLDHPRLLFPIVTRCRRSSALPPLPIPSTKILRKRTIPNYPVDATTFTSD